MACLIASACPVHVFRTGCKFKTRGASHVIGVAYRVQALSRCRSQTEYMISHQDIPTGQRHIPQHKNNIEPAEQGVPQLHIRCQTNPRIILALHGKHICTVQQRHRTEKGSQNSRQRRSYSHYNIMYIFSSTWTLAGVWDMPSGLQ